MSDRFPRRFRNRVRAPSRLLSRVLTKVAGYNIVFHATFGIVYERRLTYCHVLPLKWRVAISITILIVVRTRLPLITTHIAPQIAPRSRACSLISTSLHFRIHV